MRFLDEENEKDTDLEASVLSTMDHSSAFEKALIRTLTPKRSGSGPSSVAANTCTVTGADAGGAKWALEADLHSSFLRASLVYLDIYKIPRNHLRYASGKLAAKCNLLNSDYPGNEFIAL